MEEIKKEKQGRRGRPRTAYKVPLMVRISQEAADKIAAIDNKSAWIDELIKKATLQMLQDITKKSEGAITAASLSHITTNHVNNRIV